MGINSSHAFGIAWISVSREIFQKPLTFECLCMGIRFPHVLGIVWINMKDFFKSKSGKYMGIPIYSP